MRNEHGPEEPIESIESRPKDVADKVDFHEEKDLACAPKAIDSSADLEGAVAAISSEAAKRIREDQEAIARARFRSLGRATAMRRIGSRSRG